MAESSAVCPLAREELRELLKEFNAHLIASGADEAKLQLIFNQTFMGGTEHDPKCKRCCRAIAEHEYGGGYDRDTQAREVAGATSGDETSDKLVKFFEAQEKRRVQTWRQTSERYEAERAAILREEPEKQRQAFLDLAKSRMLSPQDVLVLNYLIYGGPEELRLLTGIMLRHFEDKARTFAHNFFIGSLKEESFMDIYGNDLMKCEWPMFPSTTEFGALNTKMLEEACREQSRGGGRASKCPSVYRQKDVGADKSASERAREIASGGDYFAPVITNEVGQSAIDLSALEAFLENRLGKFGRGRAGGGDRGGRGQRGRGFDGTRGRGASGITCYVCGLVGHVARDCDKRVPALPNTTAACPPASAAPAKVPAPRQNF